MRHVRKSSVFAVYDISSSSVAGAHVLAKREAAGKATFLAAVRNDAPLQEDIDIKRFVANTLKHLDEVISRVRKADVHHPTFIQVVLASPWYSSQTRTVTYKKETPFICTKKLVDSLVDAEIKEVCSATDGPFGVFGKDSVIIEKQLSDIKLNGYRTSAPYGKKTLSIELSLTITIAPKSIIDQFSDTFKRFYGPREIGFTSSPFATFIVMRDRISAAEKECVVIDVGEEVTDVAFIKEGILLYQHSFPVGTYGLYRTLAEQGVHTAQESVALLESYRLKKLSDDSSTSVEKAINGFISTWQSGFQHVLENGEYGFCMPGNILITADSRFENLFMASITADQFIKFNCVTDNLVVTFIDQATIESSVASGDHTALDIPLATGALFVERLL